MPDEPIYSTPGEGLLILLRSFVDNHVNYCGPGLVQSYDATSQTCSVLPADKMVNDDPLGAPIQRAVIPDVPVFFPQGGGFAVTTPLALNDMVLLVLCDVDIDTFWATGSPYTPASPRRFSRSDAICFSGITSLVNPMTIASNTDLVIGTKAGSVELRMTPTGKVGLGGPGGEVLDIVDRLIGALQSATVATSLGLQPLDVVTQSALTAIRAELGTIKI